MPFHISPHPIQPPFVCGSNELELGHRRFSPLRFVIPPRSPLDHDDLMPFHRIREAQLVFEMSQAALPTEATNSLKAIAIPTGSKFDTFIRRRLTDTCRPLVIGTIEIRDVMNRAGAIHLYWIVIQQRQWFVLLRGAIRPGQNKKQNRVGPTPPALSYISSSLETD